MGGSEMTSDPFPSIGINLWYAMQRKFKVRIIRTKKRPKDRKTLRVSPSNKNEVVFSEVDEIKVKIGHAPLPIEYGEGQCEDEGKRDYFISLKQDGNTVILTPDAIMELTKRARVFFDEAYCKLAVRQASTSPRAELRFINDN